MRKYYYSNKLSIDDMTVDHRARIILQLIPDNNLTGV